MFVLAFVLFKLLAIWHAPAFIFMCHASWWWILVMMLLDGLGGGISIGSHNNN